LTVISLLGSYHDFDRNFWGPTTISTVIFILFQLLITVAEEEIRVLALPAFATLFVHRCEEIPLVRARASHVRGLPVLMALAANGAMQVLSLPSLRVLLNVPLFRFSIDLDDP
jgi:hypothetical protein